MPSVDSVDSDVRGPRQRMGSPHWARTSGQRRGAAGSVWGWTASRLHLHWMARWMKEDEEMLVLTHQDQLNRTYEEDCVTHKGRSGDEGSGASSGDSRSLRTVPGPTGPSAPARQETRTTLVATGPRTITTTSTIPPADSFKRYEKESKSPEMQGEQPDSCTEENQNQNQNQSQNQRKPRGPRREDEDEEPGERTSRRRAAAADDDDDDDDEDDSSAHPVQSPSISTASRCHSITAWEAGWNVTNAIQGIFVLGLPFALVRSGYVGLVLLVASAWVCNHTGRILVACLYEEQQSGGSSSAVRVRHSYQDVMEACCKGPWSDWAGPAGWLVNAAQVVELLMTCTLYLVVSTSLLSDILSGLAVPGSACSLVSLAFLLPCLLLTDLRAVSTLSLLCSLAHILISLLVMLYCLSRASSWSWSCLSLSVKPEDFLVSVGVIIFSYTSQIFLPPLEGSMEDRGQFSAMLAWTHGAACVMKTMFALLAVLTWGAGTSEVITDNLPSDLRPVVNLCLLAKALLSYPLPFYSAAEILQACAFGGAAGSRRPGPGGRPVSCPALLLRGALLMASYLLALLVPRFSLLMGLTGSVTGAAMTLILPCLFHLRLRGGRLAPREQLVDVGILSLGVVCSASGVICSVRRLLEGL
ncbi:vesicular inhibitory amino acid transporter-like [Betta splendens]|uniref:Vesicular inhibitory amino acid transporter n=1 Tax=Betta splendens TaxID=158456 RepID=A0A6P7LTD4_BETSP|nr:vesicular inhibitory amino acid transporter-like [Betta splendens]